MKSFSVTIQMKAIEQYFPVIMLLNALLNLVPMDEILKCDHSKTLEQYFPVVLFVFH